MFCGIWGGISVGLFSVPKYIEISHPGANHAGAFYSDGKLLACQLIGILFVLGWVSILMTPFFAILYYKGLLRADSLEEVVGLDVSYHGVNHLTRYDNTEAGSSSNEENERLYYERREGQRKNQRNKLRRRILMMDLSISGRRTTGEPLDSATETRAENADRVRQENNATPVSTITVEGGQSHSR